MLDRDELRRWLLENAPPRMRTPPGPDDVCWGGRESSRRYPEDVLRWRDVMAERGFTAPTWPTAYGGAGLDKADAKILADEMRAQKLWLSKAAEAASTIFASSSISLTRCGPTSAVSRA